MPALGEELLDEALAFAAEWLGCFPAELRAGLDQRTAALLPCLMLARVDGKSPVEYLDEAGRQRVRDLCMPLIASPLRTISETIGKLRA